jgi:hypothetical protein
MSQRANVTSIDALEAFRSALILYVNKARPTLEEVSSEVTRTRTWLESEQRTYWENHLRADNRTLEEAQQVLFGARLSNLRKESAAEIMAVQRAKRTRDGAEEKLRKVRQWNREFESRVQPLVKQMEKLHTILANDLTQAVVYLAQVIQTLDAYAAAHPAQGISGVASAGNAPAPAADPSQTTPPRAP